MDQKEFDMRRNLIVNYLPTTLSQDDVKQMFMRIGPVSNCKLVRNTATGQSLGYAFIEYPDEDSASLAIAQINGFEMQGKTIKVSYARKSTPEIQNANVYVAGLPQWVTEDELQSLFAPFGTILSQKVLKNPDGSPRGAGFVRYNLYAEATVAIQKMSGKTLPDSTGPLTVKLAIPPASKQDSLQALNAITTNTLAGVGVANRMTSVRFNPLTPSNQILISNNLPTQHAAHQVNQHSPTGNVDSCTPASLYIFGLQPTHSELTLYELFSPFGGILSVKLIRDITKEDKPCKGYGFVNFAKYDEATKAVASMNGVPFDERILQVSFKQNKNIPMEQSQYNPSLSSGINNGYGNVGAINRFISVQ